MECTLDQSALVKALSTVIGACSVRSTLPIVTHILLSLEDNLLTCSGTNLELSITVVVPTNSMASPGRVALPSRLLVDLVGGLPKEEVRLHLIDSSNTMELMGGRASLQIRGLPAEDFPTIIQPEGQPIAVIPSGQLKRMLLKVVPAASKDQNSRPILAALLWRLQQDRLVLAAADGFRLAVAQTSGIQGSLDEEQRLVIPVGTMRELLSLLPSSDESPPVVVSLASSRNQVVLQTPGGVLSSRLVDGQFPNYDAIIPKTWASRVIVSTKDLERAVRLASFIARDNSNIIRLSSDPRSTMVGTLTVQAQAIDAGGSRSDLDATVEGAPMHLAFNATFLLEALAVIDAGLISIAVPTTGGVLLEPATAGATAGEYQHVVMPLHAVEQPNP